MPKKEPDWLTTMRRDAAERRSLDRGTAEVAGLLGISVTTLRGWVRDGKAQARSEGGRLMFSPDEVQRLFQARPE